MRCSVDVAHGLGQLAEDLSNAAGGIASTPPVVHLLDLGREGGPGEGGHGMRRHGATGTMSIVGGPSDRVGIGGGESAPTMPFERSVWRRWNDLVIF